MKTILYAVRSDGDAERLSAYCFLYRKKYKQITIIDDTTNEVSNTQITQIFKKYSKVLYLKDFYGSLFRFVIKSKILKKILLKIPFFIRYKFFEKNYLNFLKADIKFDIFFSDLTSVSLNEHLKPETFIMFMKKLLANNKKIEIISSKDGASFESKINQKKKDIHIVANKLLVGCNSDVNFFKIKKFNYKIINHALVNFDRNFINYLKNNTIRNSKYKNITLICSNQSETLKWTMKDEILFNVKFLEKIIISSKNTPYRVNVKLNPRIPVYEKTIKRIFSQQIKDGIVKIVTEKDSGIETVVKSDVICGIFSTLFIHAIFLKKKILVPDIIKKLNPIDFTDNSSLNFLNIESKDLIDFKNLKTSSRKEPFMKKYLPNAKFDFSKIYNSVI
jgi:hypothetical protein